MTVRAVEGKKPYTGGKGIEIDENKVISLRLRDENNLIIWDEGDNEIYVDLQLDDEIRPTDAFPVGITTGRVIIDNGWDKTGTLICAKTTSGDNIKIFYSDDGHLYVDHGTGLFTQVYLKPEVDALLSDLRTYVDTELAKKQDKLIAGDNIEIAQDGKTISAVLPPLNRFLSLWNCSTGMPISFPTAQLPFEYESGDHFLVETVDSTTNYKPSGTEYDGTASQTVETADVQPGDVYIYDGTTWLLQINHDKTVSFAQIAGQPSDNQALAQALNSKQDTLTAGTGINIDANDVISVDSAYMSGYIPRSSGIHPDNLANSVLYYGEYLNGGVTTSLGLASDQVGVRTDIDQQNRNRAYLEYYNGAVDLYLSDTVSGANTTAIYKSTGIESTAGGTTETFEFQGTGNNKIARLGDLLGKQDTLTAGQNINIDANNEISATDTTYNAGEGIEIKNGPDYSAMQGPAPAGFHVPLNTEWQAVYNIWTALGGGSSDGTNFGIALKLPFVGRRSLSTASVSYQGMLGYYWSSSPSPSSADSSYYLNFYSSNVIPQDSLNRAYGFPVRCFKNSPVVPNSSWTKLYGTSIEAGGIFWSSTDGLISLSSDGQTWVTIADKNLGATTVWNSGNTLSETNAGKYYQRGNNYGFPRTGRVTTSSTQVDASNYGPGNYYNSDTFITGSSDWSNVQNDDLWGGQTGVVTFNNAITNTGVLSVNGQTGDVTIQTGGTYTAGNGISIDANDEISNTLPGAIKSSTAPSNPSQGDQWYDTTNDELKIYDGSAWNAVGGGGDVGVSTQANNVFTPGMKIWGGTSANYANLTPDGNTAYLII